MILGGNLCKFYSLKEILWYTILFIEQVVVIVAKLLFLVLLMIIFALSLGALIDKIIELAAELGVILMNLMIFYSKKSYFDNSFTFRK